MRFLAILALCFAFATFPGCNKPNRPRPAGTVPRPVTVQISVLAFGAPTCGPCRRDKPRLDRIAQKFRVTKFDVTNDPGGAADQFGVTDLPTYIILVNGERRVFTNNISNVEQALGL